MGWENFRREERRPKKHTSRKLRPKIAVWLGRSKSRLTIDEWIRRKRRMDLNLVRAQLTQHGTDIMAISTNNNSNAWVEMFQRLLWHRNRYSFLLFQRHRWIRVTKMGEILESDLKVKQVSLVRLFKLHRYFQMVTYLPTLEEIWPEVEDL